MGNIIPLHSRAPKRPEPIPAVLCRLFCSHGTGHTEGANATDQWCTTAVQYVPTHLYPPILEDDGTYSAEFIKVYGISHHHGLAPRIHVGIGESFGIEITAAEARETAAALLKVANQMEVSR